jgi:TPR repeat protein
MAEQGDAPAQYMLGNMYINGRGVPQDDKEALKWYRIAAGQGHALALK